MSKIKDKADQKGIVGKLQNKCKVLTNTSSRESMIDYNKLTIEEGGN